MLSSFEAVIILVVPKISVLPLHAETRIFLSTKKIIMAYQNIVCFALKDAPSQHICVALQITAAPPHCYVCIAVHSSLRSHEGHKVHTQL